MKDLISSLRRIGALFLLGFLLICCLALGIVYVQQAFRQKELRSQIDKLNTTINQPIASIEKLKADYDEVLSSIPLLDQVVIIDKIVQVARNSGIDVTPESEKFLIPPQNIVKDVKVGDITYQLTSYRDIKAQGSYEKVMSFISNLESGNILKTAVVKSVDISLSKASDTEEPEFVAVITVDVYTKRKA